MKAAASRSAKPVGSGMTGRALTTACVAKPPVPPNAATACRPAGASTPSPTASTTPANSEPGHERQGRHLVLALHDQQVGKVEARRRGSRSAPRRPRARASAAPAIAAPRRRSGFRTARHACRISRSAAPPSRSDGAATMIRSGLAAPGGTGATAYNRRHAHPHRQRRRLPRTGPRGPGRGLPRARRHRRDRARAERERHVELADAQPGLSVFSRRPTAFASSTARRRTACTWRSPACSSTGPTWCSRASTTATTWATTRSTRAPSPRRWRASCSAFRRSRSRR